jgi:hypothetical protein
LVPRAAAPLVGQSIDDLRYATCRRLVNDGTDDRSGYYCRGCDCSSYCNRVIAAASAVITAAAVVAATVIAVVYIDIDIAVHVDVVVAVGVGVVVAINVGVVVPVLVHIAAWGGVDAGSSTAAVSATASSACATAASAAASALGKECHPTYQDDDGE